jgi:hypothetical protein
MHVCIDVNTVGNLLMCHYFQPTDSDLLTVYLEEEGS